MDESKFIKPTYGPDVLTRQLQMMQDSERARMQIEQGMQPLQGQMVSGHYIAPHWSQQLAQGLNRYQGERTMQQLPEQMAELQNMQQQQMLGQFGFGQPSPQQLAQGLSGEQPQIGIDDGVPGFTPAQGGMGQQGMPQGQGPMLLPGLNEQQSMAALQTLGPEEYMKQYAKQFSPTTLMQNVRAAGLQPGTPEYQQAMLQGTRTGTTVNVGQSEYGTIPPGWEIFTDPQTGARSMRPIAGGPVEQEAAALERKAEGAQRQKARAGTTVVQDLQRALDLIPELGTLASGEGVAGGIARTSSAKIPGTVANRITQFTESALSNVGLDTLQTMRENSPTGGALGQVPIQQQQRLEQVLGSLNINQPPAVLEANIKRVMNIYTDIIYGDAAERAEAIEQGRMTPEQSAEIDSYYYDLPFVERGRTIDQQAMPEQQRPSLADIFGG